MQNGRTRQPRAATSFSNQSMRGPAKGARQEPMGSQDAQRNYERYLELARAVALSGDLIGAENYNQHAEHYLRSMSSG
jgi:hypothetical protein